VILVDSNVPMYLVGAPHPHQTDAKRHLERALAAGERLVTDAEVLQEIIHRYTAIRRPEVIQVTFDHLLGIVDEVLPITERDVVRAKEIVLGRPPLSARDAIHVAIMEAHRIPTIMSFDRGFDRIPGIARIG
jgi:uncharacterized protein